MSEIKNHLAENVTVFDTLLNNAFELEMQIASSRSKQILNMNKVQAMFDEYQGFINFVPREQGEFLLNWRQYMLDIQNNKDDR